MLNLFYSPNPMPMMPFYVLPPSCQQFDESLPNEVLSLDAAAAAAQHPGVNVNVNAYPPAQAYLPPPPPGACGSFAGVNVNVNQPPNAVPPSSGLMMMPASPAYRFGSAPGPGVVGPLPQTAISGSFGAGAPQMAPATNAATYTLLQPTPASRPPMASLISPIVAVASSAQALTTTPAASSVAIATLSSSALASPQTSATPPSSKHPRHHSSSGASVSSNSQQKSGSHHGGRRAAPAPATFPSAEDQKAWERDRQKKDNHNVIERRRRVNINERIQELGTMLPKCNENDLKYNKGLILKETVDYINQMRQIQENLMSSNAHLAQKLQKLVLYVQQSGLQVPEFALEPDGTVSGGLKMEPVDCSNGAFAPLGAPAYPMMQTPATVAATGTIESSDGSVSNESSNRNGSE